HWPIPEEDLEQAWEEMLKLAEQGKVRYLGVSNFNVEQLERVRKMGLVASLQPPYSMLHRGVENELLSYCAENDIGVLAYSPMQRGLLTGKFSREHLGRLAPDDHRLRSPDFQKPRFGAALELVEQLKKIARRNGRTCAQLALSWVLRRDEVTAAIAGARRPEQIIETEQASDWNLSRDDIEEIEELLAVFEKKVSKKSF
ncbi:aldo/keto reductase, partial [Planctomycetota bacterium]